MVTSLPGRCDHMKCKRKPDLRVFEAYRQRLRSSCPRFQEEGNICTVWGENLKCNYPKKCCWLCPVILSYVNGEIDDISCDTCFSDGDINMLKRIRDRKIDFGTYVAEKV